MTEEINVTEEKECKCFCKSKEFKNFLTIALGTFVGVYAALSLFAAVHRPPMMPPCARGFGYGNPAPFVMPAHFKHPHQHFNKDFKCEKGKFHKVIKEINGPAPFDNQNIHDKD